MTKLPLFRIFFALAVVALLVSGQQAFAADAHHPNIKIRLAHSNSGFQVTDAESEFLTPPAANLYNVTQYAAVTSGGRFGPVSAAIPAAPTPTAVRSEIGVPEYAWLLTANTATNPDQPFGCAADTSTAQATDWCNETETWYEDFTSRHL